MSFSATREAFLSCLLLQSLSCNLEDGDRGHYNGGEEATLLS